MRRTWVGLALWVAAFFTVAASTANAQDVRYSILPMGFGRLPYTRDMLNNFGQVASVKYRGEGFSGWDEAFRTQPNAALNALTDYLGPVGILPEPGPAGGFLSRGGGINDLGQVAGISRLGWFRTLPNGPINPDTDILDLKFTAEITGINNRGQITGSAGNPATDGIEAIRTSGNGEAFQSYLLGTLRGRASFGYAINVHGQVVGESGGEAFRTAPNAPIDPATSGLGTLGGSSSVAVDINDAGIAVGWSSGGLAFVQHPFRAVPGNPIKDLGTPYGPRGYGAALAINNVGAIVGLAHPEFSGVTHAMLWQDGGFLDLAELVGPLPPLDAFDISEGPRHLEVGLDINELGQILAADSRNRLWLLTPVPVPEPSTWALLAIGLIAAPLFVRRLSPCSAAG